MNWRGTAPPTTLSRNSKPGAFGQRFDLDVADRVLTVSTGLFDVPAVAFRLAAKGFSQRYPQLDGIHGDAVAVGQCVQHHTGMRFAHAPQHDLMRLRVLLDPQRRVLGGQSSQPDRQLVLVGLGMRLNRHRQQRFRHHPRLEHQRLRLVGECVAGFGPAQTSDGAHVAGQHHRCRPLLLAQREGQRTDAFVLVVVDVAGQRIGAGVVWRTEERREMARHMNGRVGPDGPGEHPDQAEPADIGVRRRLHHLGQQRRLGAAGHLRERGALRRKDLGQWVFRAGTEIRGWRSPVVPGCRRRCRYRPESPGRTSRGRLLSPDRRSAPLRRSFRRPGNAPSAIRLRTPR